MVYSGRYIVKTKQNTKVILITLFIDHFGNELCLVGVIIILK